MHILIIEDNHDIAGNIAIYLEGKGHLIDFADNGNTGYKLAANNDYDALILDLALPGKDGLALCRDLRKEAGKDVPVLMLTARDTLDGKLEGFDAGADDYLVKPFSLMELEARLLALHRRSKGTVSNRLVQVHDLSFDPETLALRRAGQAITLKPTTKKILLLLMRASNRVVKREEIEMAIWGDDTPEGDPLRAHIYAIRNAIDKPFSEKLLHTVHGVGYRLCAPQEHR